MILDYYITMMYGIRAQYIHVINSKRITIFRITVQIYYCSLKLVQLFNISSCINICEMSIKYRTASCHIMLNQNLDLRHR